MHETDRLMVRRATWGKSIGFLFGLAALLIMYWALPESSWLFRFGTLFYYINLGLLVGIVSVDIEHPILPMEFKWWVLGPLTGGWLTFTLMLFIGNEYERMMLASETWMRNFSSPLWIIADGIVAGLIIALVVHSKVKVEA